LRENRPLDAVKFADRFDQVRGGRVCGGYLDPGSFFSRM
jgi:hypothetical protein